MSNEEIIVERRELVDKRKSREKTVYSDDRRSLRVGFDERAAPKHLVESMKKGDLGFGVQYMLYSNLSCYLNILRLDSLGDIAPTELISVIDNAKAMLDTEKKLFKQKNPGSFLTQALFFDSYVDALRINDETRRELLKKSINVLRPLKSDMAISEEICNYFASAKRGLEIALPKAAPSKEP